MTWMNELDLIKLTPLMERTSGRPEITIGLIDGPLALNHPELASKNIREIPGKMAGICARSESAACLHGTFVAGVLCARRGSIAPAICPACTFLIRPIFAESSPGNGTIPSASPTELAAAIIDCVKEGARVINLSSALSQPSPQGERELENALNFAAGRGVIVIAAAGNQGTIGSTPITRHPWVIPVAAYDLAGRPLFQSNMGNSIGKRGLGAPGENITSLGASGGSYTFGGTSAATPFVTGAIALLWSAFPKSSAAVVKSAVTKTSLPRRFTVVPPLLDAWEAYQVMVRAYSYNEGIKI
jgi:subtilisin family serine protease